ncbi:hypothetical protein ACRQ5D_18705 [Mucilaginibacter sp. P25]|uniref:hypothetical protein n=1 Tax=Mucilaginibacter sp. P25 TaxID=3423945 RepID=UPI003D7B2E81
MFFILTSSFAFGQQTFDAFCNDFVAGYTKLHLPQLELSYTNGLEHIGTAADVQKQLAFLKKLRLIYQPSKQVSSANRKT